MATQPRAKTAVVEPKPPATTAVTETHRPAATKADAPAHESREASVVEPAAKPAALEAATHAGPAELIPNASVPSLAATTISGCLETDGATFRLTDTAGEDAPKSRSWKAGFLRKRTAPIEIVDASHTLRLSSHVGQRVAATGTLIKREMQVRSLQRLTGSCG